MKTRNALVLYGVVVGTLALMLTWWVVFFVHQGDVLVARVNNSGAALSSAQALAVREAAQGSLRMFLYEGSFLFLAFVAGVVLMLRALRREVLLSRAQQDFLSAVTHELRTPLASARLSIQSLVLGRVGEDKRERYLKNTDADLARLSQLVERVLETARLATTQPRVRLEPLDLAEFVRARGAALVAECAPALALELDASSAAPVAADPAALETILRNLLANAAKYAAAAGRVQICVTRDAREAQLVVRDFGSGVRGDPAKLFEPFVRGAGPLEKSQPGVGLGLYLVAELARAQGGRVSARNAPAGGFEVELTLPCDSAS